MASSHLRTMAKLEALRVKPGTVEYVLDAAHAGVKTLGGHPVYQRDGKSFVRLLPTQAQFFVDQGVLSMRVRSSAPRAEASAGSAPAAEPVAPTKHFWQG